MSRPSILQPFICITGFGGFLFPFCLVTSMVAHTSVSMFLVLTALHPLCLIFPLGIFCALLFPCACCYVLLQSLHCHCIDAALPWQARLSHGARKLMHQGGSYPRFPHTLGPDPRCQRDRWVNGQAGSGGPPAGLSLSRVLKAVRRLG